MNHLLTRRLLRFAGTNQEGGDPIPTIRIREKNIECECGETLYKALRRGGIEINAPCGGSGTCQKCHVWIEGVGRVKACEYIVIDNITVSMTLPRSEIVTKGLLRDVMCDTKKACIAIDIGTTTVVVYLINNGQVIDIESSINSQKSYGDDVVTRIKFTMENDNGTEILFSLINNQIKEMINTLCRRNNILIDSIIDIAIAGNTTMLHLYAGISPATIGVVPFTPVFTGLRKIGKTTLLNSISGYVGADTVAAILASGMHLSGKKSLLVDIGTNGEIALGSSDGIVTCAAAAGPAFEGSQISCGVGGVAGAINSITFGDKITYTTIDHIAPIGICGSAIVDAVAQMLHAGIIDETGYFEKEEMIITGDISINSRDVRQVQLAKAAIAAGINTLLIESNTKLKDIGACYLAGSFGSNLNKKSICDIGLIPGELIDKIQPIGNAAGMGAVLWLISSQCKVEVEQIVNITKYLELSGSTVFNEQFINCMTFK